MHSAKNGGQARPVTPPASGPCDAHRAPHRALHHHWRCALLVGLTSAFLVACGGGGGGGGGDDTTPPATALPSTLAPVVPQDSQQSGAAVAFGAGVNDPAQKLRYQWQFGDGSSSTVAAPSHTFALPGRYNVQLTVTNEAGEVRTAQASVNVADLALTQGRQCNTGYSTVNSTGNSTGNNGKSDRFRGPFWSLPPDLNRRPAHYE